MRRFSIILTFLLLTAFTVYANDIGEILDKVYYQSKIDETNLRQLGNYKFKQYINFIKMDGDGEVEEHTKREYEVFIKSENDKRRKLISAQELQDAEWIDVTEKLKQEKKEGKSQSREFSLTDMVSPQNRSNYQFELIGEEKLQEVQTIRLKVVPLIEEQEYFSGDMWFDVNDYSLVKANLTPVVTPIGVKSMSMVFEMAKVAGNWVPSFIQFDAQISFLFFFKGKIHSEIKFDGYEFDQSFNNGWYDQQEQIE